MAIIKIIFRKLLNNRWLSGSLFLGMLITISLVSTIPTYTSSVMQKLLTRELQDYQINEQVYSGEISFVDSFNEKTSNDPAKALIDVESTSNELLHKVNLPILHRAHILSTKELRVNFEEESRRTPTISRGKLVTITELEDHITLIDGTYPRAEEVDGVIEVLVSEQALSKRKMVLGTKLIIQLGKEKLIINPVGTYRPNLENEVYWTLVDNTFSSDFIVNEEWFRNTLLTEHGNILGNGKFSYAIDYNQIKVSDFQALLTLDAKIHSSVKKIHDTQIKFNYPIKSILKTYEQKSKQMTMMLWALNLPILIMLAIYLFMISKLIIQRQLNEIAIFISRGASRLQVLFIYFVEIFILSFLAFILGPFIGLQLCKVLGATNGFLDFVQRSSLPVELSADAFIYAFITMIISIFMVMIPVYQATAHNIVHRKQADVKGEQVTKWYVILFEITLLSIAVYSMYDFNRKQNELLKLDINSTDLMVDSTLFFMPAIFIIGIGLLILRLYPYLLKFINRIGQKYWSVSLYSTFLQVSRSTTQYKFLMIFLIITIGMGVFSASAARTINENLEEQLLYEHGADMRLKLRWQSNAPQTMNPNNPNHQQPIADLTDLEHESIVYTEPSFDPKEHLSHLEEATKVLTKTGITVQSDGKTIYNSQLMAIEPNKFGKVVWFKNNLLPYHWYNYLNLLSYETSSVIISNKIANQLNVSQGDYLTITWDNGETGEVVVHEVVEYWPTFNQLQTGEDTSDGALIVANLPYIQNVFGLEPYEWWLKFEENALRANIYDELKAANISIIGMQDIQPEMIELKNSALLLGVNGTMSLGFIISLVVSFIGFLIYWILTIKARTVQYGIYRAMGLRFKNILAILTVEQLLTSGFACMVGVVVGTITSKIYVPFFKISMNIKNVMPPFTVVFDPNDERKIYIFVAFMLLFGLFILFYFLKKMKIDQAIKLGED